MAAMMRARLPQVFIRSANGISICGVAALPPPAPPRALDASLASAEAGSASEPPFPPKPALSTFMPDCLSASSSASIPDVCFTGIPSLCHVQ